MDQDDGGGVPRQRGPERLAGMEDALVEDAPADFLDAEEMVLRIEENHADALVVEEAHLLPQQRDDVGGDLDDAGLGDAAAQPRAQAEGGDELERLGGADALDLREGDDVGAGQAVQVAVAGDDLLGDVEGRGALPAGTEEDRDQLGGLKRGRAVLEQPLAGPFAFGQFPDSCSPFRSAHAVSRYRVPGVLSRTAGGRR